MQAPHSFESIMSKAIASTNPDAKIQIERDDGHISIHKMIDWLSWDTPDDPLDSLALDHANEGPVLDVGCATGKYVYRLSQKGIRAHGIDPCEEAINFAHKKHVLNCTVGNIWHPEEWMKGHFKSILLLGGNMGISGTLRNLPRFINTVHSLCRPEGKILFSSVDWRIDPNNTHKQRNDTLIREEKNPGEVSIRIRYDDLESSWFPWLWATPDDIARTAVTCGLKSTVISYKGARYLGCLHE